MNWAARRVCGVDLVYAATNKGMGLDFNLQNKTQFADGVLWEMRLREYKSTLIVKGLNYFIEVKLLILETSVSQHIRMEHVLYMC